jgi:hypothetical protein
MARKALLVGVAIGAVAVLMVAALLPAVTGYSEVVFVRGNRGGHGGGPWWRNATVTQEQVRFSGILSDLDVGLMVLSTPQGTISLKVPVALVVDNKAVSLLKLVFDGKLRKDDRIEVDALIETVTRPDRTTWTTVIIQQIRDLDTGLTATVLGRGPWLPAWTTSSQQTTA